MKSSISRLALAPIIALALASPALAQKRAEQCPRGEQCDEQGRVIERSDRAGREDRREKREAAKEERREKREAAQEDRREKREAAQEDRREKREAAKEERQERRQARQDADKDAGQIDPQQAERPANRGDQEAVRDENQTKPRAAQTEPTRQDRSDQAAAPQDTAPQDTAPQDDAPKDDTVEKQLEAQGDRDEARSVRGLRERMARQLRQARDERDREAAQEDGRRGADRQERAASDADRRRNRREAQGDRPRDARRDGRVVGRRGARIVLDLGGGRLTVRSNLPDEGGRLLFGARDVDVDPIRGGGTRTVVQRRNGSRIITERDRNGEIVLRKRVTPNGREVVLIDNRGFDGRRDRRYRRPRISIPSNRYIVDLGRASRREIRATLLADTVEPLDQHYSLHEVLEYEPVRAYAPRIDLDTITFDFGSATIGDAQMGALADLGAVMEEVLAENPGEVYLIEGHTDAVGSNYDNLILSDQRAEAVAVALSQNFDIPPENLVTQGFGEQHLKVETQSAERRNRRATVRRVTQLLAEN